MPHPPCIFGHIPVIRAYNRFIYTIVLQCRTKELANLQTIGWGGPPTLPAQRACSSESGACTSMTSSSSPGSSGVEHKVEQSESDRRSLKVRGCLSSIMDAHSHDHLCSSISGSASPCPHVLSPGGALGFDCPPSLHLLTLIILQEGWEYTLIILLLHLLTLIILLHPLMLIFQRGFISPGQEVTGPELCNVVCLLGGGV